MRWRALLVWTDRVRSWVGVTLSSRLTWPQAHRPHRLTGSPASPLWQPRLTWPGLRPGEQPSLTGNSLPFRGNSSAFLFARAIFARGRARAHALPCSAPRDDHARLFARCAARIAIPGYLIARARCRVSSHSFISLYSSRSIRARILPAIRCLPCPALPERFAVAFIFWSRYFLPRIPLIAMPCRRFYARVDARALWRCSARTRLRALRALIPNTSSPLCSGR